MSMYYMIEEDISQATALADLIACACASESEPRLETMACTGNNLLLHLDRISETIKSFDTDQVEGIAEVIRQHDIEWIREFKELIDTIKGCTPEQVEQLIRTFEAMKKEG